MELIASLLPFGIYTPAFNAYNPNAYPVHKKISAEEWNSLWLSSFAQGNRQETILKKLINEDISLLLNTVNIIIKVSNDHELRLITNSTTINDHATRIIALEQRMTSVETINEQQNQRLNTIETDLPTRAVETSVAARVLDLQTQINNNETSTVNRVDNLQGQINVNKTNIDSIQSDYIRKQDNPENILTELSSMVSDTGAYVTTRRIKDIKTGVASVPVQEIPIPVVDHKARLFQPGEIETLRDLESWKESLLGMSLNHIMDFSDRPWAPQIDPPINYPIADIQAYVTNKWNSLGITQEVPDQSTLNDMSLPLRFTYYINGAQWVLTKGSPLATATNNKYDAEGKLISSGIVGTVIGADAKKFYGIVEPNGEFTITGLDDMETTLLNTKALAEDLQKSKSSKYNTRSQYRTSLNVGMDLSGATLIGNKNAKGGTHWGSNRIILDSSMGYKLETNSVFDLYITNSIDSSKIYLYVGGYWNPDIVLPEDFGIITRIGSTGGSFTEYLENVLTTINTVICADSEWNYKNKINLYQDPSNVDKFLGIDSFGIVNLFDNEPSRMTICTLNSINYKIIDVYTNKEITFNQLLRCRKIDIYLLNVLKIPGGTVSNIFIPTYEFVYFEQYGAPFFSAYPTNLVQGRNELYYIPVEEFDKYNISDLSGAAPNGLFVQCTDVPSYFEIGESNWSDLSSGGYEYIIFNSRHMKGTNPNVYLWNYNPDSASMYQVYDSPEVSSDGHIRLISNKRVKMRVKVTR